MAAVQGVAVQGMGGDVESRADKAVRPVRCNRDEGAEQSDTAAGIGAAQEHDVMGWTAGREPSWHGIAGKTRTMRSKEGPIAGA